MSVHLQDRVIAHLRSVFTAQEVPTVQSYAGEFSAEEVDRLSFAAPAILVAVLGWGPTKAAGRLSGKHVRQVKLAAFVVAKGAKREERMREAQVLAERLSLTLRSWMPQDVVGQAVTIGALEDEPGVENLYGSAIDKRGLALWLVDWTQCVRPDVPLPELWDLLRVDIEDTAVQGTVSAAPAPAETPLVVTESVAFHPV